MSKRTYSRRTLTIAPSTYSSPPVERDSRKRRKLNQSDDPDWVPRNNSLKPSKFKGHKSKSKKFGALVSVPDKDSEMVEREESPEGGDPFKGLIKHFKNKHELAASQPQGSLHGGREAFNDLINANRKISNQEEKKQAGDRLSENVNWNNDSPTSERIKAEKHSTSAPSIHRFNSPRPSGGFASALLACPQAKIAFEEKEYISSQTKMPSKDFHGKRLSKDSREAALWSVNQASSPLLRLPMDIRKQIYELVLGGKTIEIGFSNYDTKTFDKQSPEKGKFTLVEPKKRYYSLVHSERHTALRNFQPPHIKTSRGMTLLNDVCRQLYLETSTLPYKLNTLAFVSYNTFFNFIAVERRLTRHQLRAIEAIIVWRQLPGSNILPLMPNLKHVLVMAPADEPKYSGRWCVVQGEKHPILVRESMRSNGPKYKF